MRLPSILFLLLFAVTVQAQQVPNSIPEYIETMAQAVVEGNDAMRNRMFIKLRIVGKPAVEPLIATLKDPRPGVPEYAAFTLGWIADDRAVEPLEGMLGTDNPDRARAAMKALGNMQAVQAAPAIKPFLASENVMIRRDAVYSIGLMRDKSLLELVEPMRKDDDKVVRFLAEEAVQRIETGW